VPLISEVMKDVVHVTETGLSLLSDARTASQAVGSACVELRNVSYRLP
jgi:hypothetical protein